MFNNINDSRWIVLSPYECALRHGVSALCCRSLSSVYVRQSSLSALTSSVIIHISTKKAAVLCIFCVQLSSGVVSVISCVIYINVWSEWVCCIGLVVKGLMWKLLAKYVCLVSQNTLYAGLCVMLCTEIHLPFSPPSFPFTHDSHLVTLFELAEVKMFDISLLCPFVNALYENNKHRMGTAGKTLSLVVSMFALLWNHANYLRHGRGLMTILKRTRVLWSLILWV